jgi:hypothetical protein
MGFVLIRIVSTSALVAFIGPQLDEFYRSTPTTGGPTETLSGGK